VERNILGLPISTIEKYSGNISLDPRNFMDSMRSLSQNMVQVQMQNVRLTEEVRLLRSQNVDMLNTLKSINSLLQVNGHIPDRSTRSSGNSVASVTVIPYETAKSQIRNLKCVKEVMFEYNDTCIETAYEWVAKNKKETRFMSRLRGANKCFFRVLGLETFPPKPAELNELLRWRESIRTDIDQAYDRLREYLIANNAINDKQRVTVSVLSKHAKMLGTLLGEENVDE
jgi:hypothetical protein